MSTTMQRLLTSDDLEELAGLSAQMSSGTVSVFEAAMGDAVGGSPRAVRAYVDAWVALSDELFAEVSQLRPHVNGGLVADAAGEPSELARQAVIGAASQAPFSAAVGRFGTGRGGVLYLVLRLREVLPGIGVPAVPARLSNGVRHWDVSSSANRRFHRLVDQQLQSEAEPISRLRELFELSVTDVARLFGVSRQAVEQWQETGVPTSRREKLLALQAVGELLERKLRPGLLPSIARRPAPAFDGKTLLQLAAVDHERLRETVERSLDWSGTA